MSHTVQLIRDCWNIAEAIAIEFDDIQQNKKLDIFKLRSVASFISLLRHPLLESLIRFTIHDWTYSMYTLRQLQHCKCLNAWNRDTKPILIHYCLLRCYVLYVFLFASYISHVSFFGPVNSLYMRALRAVRVFKHVWRHFNGHWTFNG